MRVPGASLATTTRSMETQNSIKSLHHWARRHLRIRYILGVRNLERPSLHRYLYVFLTRLQAAGAAPPW